jgi:hypothetical protein
MKLEVAVPSLKLNGMRKEESIVTAPLAPRPVSYSMPAERSVSLQPRATPTAKAALQTGQHMRKAPLRASSSSDSAASDDLGSSDNSDSNLSARVRGYVFFHRTVTCKAPTAMRSASVGSPVGPTVVSSTYIVVCLQDENIRHAPASTSGVRSPRRQPRTHLAEIVPGTEPRLRPLYAGRTQRARRQSLLGSASSSEGLFQASVDDSEFAGLPKPGTVMFNLICSPYQRKPLHHICEVPMGTTAALLQGA